MPKKVRTALGILGRTQCDPETGVEHWRGAQVAHFGAIRGKDLWKDFDTVIIISRNEPPPRAIDQLARAFFADEPERLRLVGDERFPRRPRGYRMRNSEQLGAKTAIHPDPHAQRLLEQIRERESVQAIDRLRLVHTAARKRVIILSSVPLDITVDEVRTLDELAGTPGRIGPRGRLRAALDRAGIVPLGKRDLAAAFPDLFPSQARAKDALRALSRGADNGGEYQIEYIFEMHPQLGSR